METYAYAPIYRMNGFVTREGDGRANERIHKWRRNGGRR